ncbi:MAG: sulfotransferase family protein [Pirellulales bacterium]
MSTENVITVVTGLPRSGTSMMMQMLAAGGLPVLTDGQRTADEDNPRGYFECDKVRSLRSDNRWLTEANGKAVKVIAQLLEYLPDENYRLVFMQRDLSEVISSQRTMLDRSGKQGARLTHEQLANVFSKQIDKVDRIIAARNMPVLRVSYRACIDTPEAVAANVNRFLRCGLDERAMAASVDTRLYRQRNKLTTLETL